MGDVGAVRVSHVRGAVASALLALALATCGEPVHQGNVDGIIEACERHLRAPGVDHRRSSAQHHRANVAHVQLRDPAGTPLGDCTVAVTRGTYAVSRP
jgi:hypothetical protein